jgi:hypothetical protein
LADRKVNEMRQRYVHAAVGAGIYVLVVAGYLIALYGGI